MTLIDSDLPSGTPSDPPPDRELPMNAVGGSPAVASPLPASPTPDGVIERLVAWAVQQRALVAGLVLALVGAGLWALNTLRVDAFPDLTDVQVQVLNLLGQNIWETNASRTTNLSETLDLTTMPDGLYLVRLTVDGQTATRKLIKSRP